MIPIFAFMFVLTLTQLDKDISVNHRLLLFVDAIFLAVLCFPILIDAMVRTIGAQKEQIFLLSKPKIVSFFTAFVWTFFWIDIFFFIKCLTDHHYLISAPLIIIALFILAFLFYSTINLSNRRVVVVPNGIVLSDSLTLSDTILLPLTKIEDVRTINIKTFIKRYPKIRRDKIVSENSYIGNIGLGDVIHITLTDKTDSFIVRKNHLNTERKDIDELFLSLESPAAFRKHFGERFHKSSEEPKKVDPKKEKIAMLKLEKELGIETAPKSDSKLPQWRDKGQI